MVELGFKPSSAWLQRSISQTLLQLMALTATLIHLNQSKFKGSLSETMTIAEKNTIFKTVAQDPRIPSEEMQSPPLGLPVPKVMVQNTRDPQVIFCCCCCCCWLSLNWLFRTREMKLKSIFTFLVKLSKTLERRFFFFYCFVLFF